MKTLIPDADTLKYYENVYEEYARFSSSIDMKEQWSAFASKLPYGSKILDLGCGTGRDIKHFLDLGFKVDGLEPSVAMATYTRLRTGVEVFDLAAEQIEFEEEYDGIWACASLMHMRKSAFAETLPKVVMALKFGGYFYFSLKRGAGEIRNEDGRLFSFYEMEEVVTFLSRIGHIQVVERWTSKDMAGRSETQWINVLIRRLEK